MYAKVTELMPSSPNAELEKPYVVAMFDDNGKLVAYFAENGTAAGVVNCPSNGDYPAVAFTTENEALEWMLGVSNESPWAISRGLSDMQVVNGYLVPVSTDKKIKVLEVKPDSFIVAISGQPKFSSMKHRPFKAEIFHESMKYTGIKLLQDNHG